MIGKNILEIRKKRALSLTELAERANISKSYLSNIERDLNKNPSIQVMNKIAAVLNVDLKTLIKADSKYDTKQGLEKEWIDFIYELKESGIEKEQIKEFRSFVEFIRWKKEYSAKK
ncbi:XRE family transcriptional regulator [Bacillus sp. 1NLA3E]|uniref:XRE family transcriptional regulator n=1 Tax=Bacillus sp. 1NLA3E TaxID=666686 RepID=UPI000247E8AF|nr:XRE family transcriptional regulator [Bacillus sp. 1NLA3E]AGK52657.1 transcriptional regulator SinR [Bacillus sp. 1NLA3E]